MRKEIGFCVRNHHFRYENRDPDDGSVFGCYGYNVENAVNESSSSVVVTRFAAGINGFRIYTRSKAAELSGKFPPRCLQ